ncbi:MAG: DUF1788 domain-containing protein [Spirochaetota bacterium]
MTSYDQLFNTFFNIMSSSRFLAMEGLGNEIPYFIHAYNIKDQRLVYQKIEALVKRLERAGIRVALFGLYDFTIHYFKQSGELEDLFELEPILPKARFFEEMVRMLPPDSVIVPAIQNEANDKNAQIVILWQAGEVYPYIRAHEILSNLQSTLSDRPVVLFFPGEYLTSEREGYKLKLFGNLEARYYRAFKLEEYIIRGNLNDNA